MLGTNKVRDAKKRENEFLEKAVEKAERESKKVKFNEQKKGESFDSSEAREFCGMHETFKTTVGLLGLPPAI